jgi:DNA modification methylase
MIQINGNNAQITINQSRIDLTTYPLFLKVKGLPRYQIRRDIDTLDWYLSFPAEYAERFDSAYRVELTPLPLPIPDFLFDRQKLAVRVMWHKKRYGLFWDAGLGKTIVFLELCRQLVAAGKKCLIISPLNVIGQTMDEAMLHYDMLLANYHDNRQGFHKWRKSASSTVAIINHEAFNRPLDLSGIDAVFIDESDVLKAEHGTRRTNMTNACKGIERKYLFSATQAPNEHLEYGQAAVFLEMVRSYTEFKALYFVQKGDGWQLRRWSKDKFYASLASWSWSMRNPDRFGLEPVTLPELREVRQEIDVTQEQLDLINASLPQAQAALPGMPTPPGGLDERQIYNQISKGFRYIGKAGKGRTVKYVTSNKPRAIREFIQAHPDRIAIVWTVFDEEGEIIQRELEENTGLVVSHLTGKTPVRKRLEHIAAFQRGEIDVLISKPRLLGLGLNLHIASLVVFSGLQDSYRDFYQAYKRSYRFPQERDVIIFLPVTVYEEAILDNVLNKRDRAENDYRIQEGLYHKSLYAEISKYLAGEMLPVQQDRSKQMLEPVITDEHELYHTDSIEHSLNAMDEDSVHLIVTSPPFRNDLFAYTDDVSDVGNSGGVGQLGRDEFMLHLSYSLKGMFRVLKPGRLACIEIDQSPLRLGVDGLIGISDFRGDVIRLAEEQGFTFWAEIPILGNPQADAITKHISTLTLKNFHKDRAGLAPMMITYILVFKKPGVNDTPVIDPYKLEGKADDLDGIPLDTGTWTVIHKKSGKSRTFYHRGDAEIFLAEVRQMRGLFGSFEEWIEHADPVWQLREYNRGLGQYQGVSQKERFKAYLTGAEVTLNEAIQTMMGAWVDIDGSDTLNTPYNRGRTKEEENADKHVCPFARGIPSRCIRLWSNPDETVLDPFAGIGTTIEQALLHNRRVIGLELKAEYFLQMCQIAEKTVNRDVQLEMF